MHGGVYEMGPSVLVFKRRRHRSQFGSNDTIINEHLGTKMFTKLKKKLHWIRCTSLRNLSFKKNSEVLETCWRNFPDQLQVNYDRIDLNNFYSLLQAFGSSMG